MLFNMQSICYFYVRVLLCICMFKLSLQSGESLKLSSVNKTYYNGVQAYEGERWTECITQMEESLHLYKLYRTIITNCRLECDSEVHKSMEGDNNMEDLKIIEKFFNARHCLNNCQENSFKNTHLESDLNEAILTAMLLRKPYEYLHICYFQMNMLPKAASAALTYLVANPTDEQMMNNLKYYIEQPEVDEKEVVDYLSEDYMVLYKLGVEAYRKSNWGETVASMEAVITDYLSWEGKCRAECERQPEQEWSPEYTITVANNMASLLHCRQHCQDDLKPLGFKSGVEFLADVLNYLQISYYRLDRLTDAAINVASFLTLLPQDEDMLINKDIYETIAPLDAFKIRSDIEHYVKQDKYEKNLLQFFHQGHGNEVDTNAI